MDEQKLKEIMIVKDAEFKKLYEEHKKHEETLAVLKGKPVLSETEKLEEKELKKIKLAIKDRMYQMMAEYQKSL
jgi:hypothetical protein